MYIIIYLPSLLVALMIIILAALHILTLSVYNSNTFIITLMIVVYFAFSLLTSIFKNNNNKVIKLFIMIKLISYLL